jgi:16S rRNA G966 N2-methylase RsmD
MAEDPERPKHDDWWYEDGGQVPPYRPVPATILDPFAGSGTVGLVANRLSRRAILIDLSTEYMAQVMKRNQQAPLGVA